MRLATAVLGFMAVIAAMSCADLTAPAEHAGEGGAFSRVGDLGYETSLRIEMRDTVPWLVAQGKVTNFGSRTLDVDYGACALHLAAFTDSARRGSPSWRLEARQPWNASFEYGCDLYGVLVRLRPGESISGRELQVQFPLIELLSDSLPDGRYYFGARFGLNVATDSVLPAGWLDLKLGRVLQSTRTAGQTQFVAEPVSVSSAPAVLSAAGELRRTNPSIHFITTPKGCAIRLLAYRDRARRDAAPRSGAPDWAQPLNCLAGQDTTWIPPQEVSRHQTTVAVSEILGAGQPHGHYYFAVELRGGTRVVTLSAGDADL